MAEGAGAAMKDLLSQAEIDALLAAVKDEPAVPGIEPKPSYAQFDLASRQQPKARRLPGLEQLSKRFAEHFRSSLLDVLGQDVDVSLLELQFSPYAEYLHSLYIPSSMNLMRVEPLLGTAMMVFDARLVFRLVEIYFGGSEAQGVPDGRDFSPSERRLIGKLLSRAHADFEEACKPVAALQCKPMGTELNPSLANIVGAADTVVVCRFQLDAEGGGGGELHMCFPLAMLEPLRESLSQSELAQSRAPDPQWQGAMQRAVLDTPLPTRCVLADKAMTLGQVANLKVGDVLSLGSCQQAEIRASGVSLLKASVGMSKGQLALKIKGRA